MFLKDEMAEGTQLGRGYKNRRSMELGIQNLINDGLAVETFTSRRYGLCISEREGSKVFQAIKVPEWSSDPATEEECASDRVEFRNKRN